MSTTEQARPGRLRHAALLVSRVALAVILLDLSFLLGTAVVRVAAARFGNAGPLAVAALAVLALVLLAAWRLPPGPLLLFVAALPVGLTPLPGGLVQVVQAAALVAAAAVVGPAVLTGRLRTARTPLWGWVVLFVVTAAIATPGAADVGRAIRGDLNLVIGVLLALAVVLVARDPERLLALHRALVLVGGATCATGLGGAGLSASFGGAVVEGRAVGVFTQPNELGMFSAVVLALAAALAARPGTTPAWRVVGVAAAGAAVGALALSLSRGAWLGAAAGVVTLLVVLPAARAALARYAVPTALAFAAWAATQPGTAPLQLVVQRAGTITDRAANPYDNRDAIWAEGARQVRAAPVAGHGPGSFLVVSSRSASGTASVSAVHAHNLWLTVGAEQGLLAVLAVVGLQLAVLRRAGRVKRLPAARAATHAGAVAAGAALVVHGLVDYPQRNPTLFMVSWLVIGLCLAAAADVDESVSARRRR